MEEKYCCLLKKISWLYYKQFTSHKQLMANTFMLNLHALFCSVASDESHK